MTTKRVIPGNRVPQATLFYQLYKYLFLYVYQQPATTDTGGLFYPKAYQHVLTGLYVQHICLCALFFLATDSNGHHSAVAEGALMVVLIVITAGFHAILNNSYGPLLKALPLSLQDRTYTPPIIDPSGTTRADSSTAAAADAHTLPEVEEEEEEDVKYEKRKNSISSSSNNPKKRSSSEDEDGDGDDDDDEKKKLAEQKLVKGSSVPDKAAQEDEFETYGFSHPAASRPQRTVWIPKDTLGLTEEEVKGCEEAKVKVGFRNAMLDGTGKVDIDGGPPDLI